MPRDTKAMPFHLREHCNDCLYNRTLYTRGRTNADAR